MFVSAGGLRKYPFSPLFVRPSGGYGPKMTEAGTALRAHPLRVVLVDDHAMIRQGLRSLLETAADVEVSGEAGGLADALDVIQRSHPDVVLLDLRLGEEDGLELARTCREKVSDVHILVLSAYGNSQQLHDAFAAGADGYLLKGATATDLVDGLRRTARGETVIDPSLIPMLLETMQPGGSEVLTAREIELLGMVADGQTPQAVATHLGISLRTVQKHLENMHRKLGVASRAELVQQAFRRGLLR